MKLKLVYNSFNKHITIVIGRFEFALVCKMSAETTTGDVDMQGLPTSTSDSSTLNLDHDVTEYMNKFSKSRNPSLSWNESFPWVLRELTEKLATSSVRNKVIYAALTYAEAETEMNNFKEDENMWKEATRQGMEEGDWNMLINLSMCLFRNVYLSLFVFKQNNSKIQNSKIIKCRLCSPRSLHRT
jgi:hypothetical protein